MEVGLARLEGTQSDDHQADVVMYRNKVALLVNEIIMAGREFCNAIKCYRGATRVVMVGGFCPVTSDYQEGGCYGRVSTTVCVT